MADTTEKTSEANTPRSRNHVFDKSQALRSPDGYEGNDWTLRKQIEADFRALGFRSHKFSHKNEPAERIADSLWLSWNSDSKKRPVGATVTDIEARVTFAGHEGPYFIDRETIVTVTYSGRGSGGCIPRRMGEAVFTLAFNDIRDVVEHVKYLISKQSV